MVKSPNVSQWQDNGLYYEYMAAIKPKLPAVPARLDCDWLRAPTAKSLFGTNIHPDLAKLQCEQGALYSYRKAESNLAKFNIRNREVNNHTQIKRISGKVGEILSQKNAQPLRQEKLPTIVSELIVQVDGGHIPIQDQEQRSFEALAAVVYRPENLIRIDKNHCQIVEKTCVVSAQADELKTVKSYLINAAKKQGLGETTKVIALADGAKNC